jgi:hypothetical protein
MSKIQATDLRIGDVKESIYGGDMKVWSISPDDYGDGTGILVTWDLGAAMNYMMSTALYNGDRNPVFDLKNR